MQLNEKIIYGLERLSDVFRTLLWQKAKEHGVSPIQIQLMLFVANHKEELCNVTSLAGEFNLTKPTVSDAIKVLHKKGHLEKSYSSSDGRSYTLFLTTKGTKLIQAVGDYALPISKILSNSQISDLESLYVSLAELIYDLNQVGVIQVQRTCLGCRFYDRKGEDHYCNFLKASLKVADLQLDCPEYEERLITVE